MTKTVAIAILAGAAALAQEYRLSAPVPAFSLATLQGGAVSFRPVESAATVVIFMSTKCPVSNRYSQRMIELYKDYSAKGVQFVFVNANQNEPPEEIVEHSRAAGYPFPVYKDSGNVLADKFGAQFTPETFVIDKTGVLRYHGRIDDAQTVARVQQHSLRLAIDAVLAGRPVDPAETRAFGCT
ncbi:MAG: redoxin domain-containing protein, partial [Candidatus Solibacter usitatus]|nr:redoxin domain-containing protein [Candidatus Solibacter usitatus]